jgi:predicted short-subunit dehydrogenase-like oxidoreductase (DUF2520 family)
LRIFRLYQWWRVEIVNMRITLIGSGNVATVLGKLFLQAGHTIVQVCGRNEKEVKQLAGILQAGWCVDLNAITPHADLYILAVSDSAVSTVAAQLKLDKKLVVHTAASVSKDVLATCSKNYGIIYPLQSLRKEMDAIPPIPLLVDGNTEDDCTLIYDIATSISTTVQKVSDEQRLKLHVAAVIVSNFTNHLYALAQAYCEKETLDFKLLLPLIQSIAERLQYFNAAEVQTGPAIRNDLPTINRHLEVLKDHPELAELYKIFTKSIQGQNAKRGTLNTKR